MTRDPSENHQSPVVQPTENSWFDKNNLKNDTNINIHTPTLSRSPVLVPSSLHAAEEEVVADLGFMAEDVNVVVKNDDGRTLQTNYSLSASAAKKLPFLLELPEEPQDITDIERAGTGVLCLAGHIDGKAKTSSVYLQQCAYALTRWKDAFNLAGGKYLDYKLAIVTDRQRFRYQIANDASFRRFVEDTLTHPVFFDEWQGVPQVSDGFRGKLPQSTKFQGFPQLWVHKFEALARSPFKYTLFTDYDLHACPGAEQIFDFYQGVDIAPMDCEFRCWGGTRQQKDYGAYVSQLPSHLKKEYVDINEPLTAGILVRTESSKARRLCLLARDIYIKTMRTKNNPIKHDQPALREAIFLAAHHVNSTRIHENLGCDFKLHQKCEDRCMFVHGKISVDPIVAGRDQIKTWASRVGQR
eukprot:CAMPEP_0198213466 /NCGR_PEP_ID=MMETSP1445-20131203/28884_1 /TAXON_ID=36898 /ORGANISM="Pyramimonas sp., Strain CCMP2087" /LENGTH=411 /DNA_ID=CAMNT_0043888117 /DNA_START=354 /DNA_END=1589 /DNA_ORIENTATION=+